MQAMSESERWKAPTIVPILAYEDVVAAIEWLTRVFGFEERSEARLSWEGGVRAWMEIGEGLIVLSDSGGHDRHSPKLGGNVHMALKVYVDDVDGHFRRAKAAGAVILSEPEDGFWGGRVYRAQDLEGHQWEFSQANRDLPATAWKLPPGMRRG